MKRELMCLAGIVSVVVGLTTFNAMAETYTVQGTVTGVQPVYKTKTVTEPVQRCWTEEVPVYGQTKNNESSAFGLDLEGAIIGGIIGNNVTKNVENGGAAGAIIGGLIGSDMKKKKNQEITGYRQVNKCATEYNSRTEEYLAGYKIDYSALGLTGSMSSTRSRNVGDNINVNVQISAY